LKLLSLYWLCCAIITLFAVCQLLQCNCYYFCATGFAFCILLDVLVTLLHSCLLTACLIGMLIMTITITFIKVIHSCFSKSWRPLYFLHIFISYFLEAGFLTIVYQHSETFALCCCRFHKCCCASFLKMPTKRSEQQKWAKTPHLSATCLLFMEASMPPCCMMLQHIFLHQRSLYSIGVSPIRCQTVKWSQRGTKDYLILVYYRHMLFLSLKREF